MKSLLICAVCRNNSRLGSSSSKDKYFVKIGRQPTDLFRAYYNALSTSKETFPSTCFTSTWIHWTTSRTKENVSMKADTIKIDRVYLMSYYLHGWSVLNNSWTLSEYTAYQGLRVCRRNVIFIIAPIGSQISRRINGQRGRRAIQYIPVDSRISTSLDSSCIKNSISSHEEGVQGTT